MSSIYKNCFICCEEFKDTDLVQVFERIVDTPIGSFTVKFLFHIMCVFQICMNSFATVKMTPEMIMDLERKLIEHLGKQKVM
jgi:hypothetical protein